MSCFYARNECARASPRATGAGGMRERRRGGGVLKRHAAMMAHAGLRVRALGRRQSSRKKRGGVCRYPQCDRWRSLLFEAAMARARSLRDAGRMPASGTRTALPRDC
eukprot:361289-Chlamydomonas_euryale.AAC.2